jgi:hypothetical protein
MGIFSFLFKRKNQKEEKKKKLLEELNLFIEQIKEKKKIEPIKTDLLLKEGEEAYLEEKTTLLETRSVRYHSTKAVGFRVTRGVYVGIAPGKSESQEEWRAIDEGIIALTNERLIFDGSKEERIIPLRKIISARPENRRKSMLFTVNNPLIWVTFIHILVKGGDLKKIEDLKVDIVDY